MHLYGNSLDSTNLAYQSSAAAHIDTWKSPVFLVHGDDDRNVDFGQTIGLVNLLRAHNIYYELTVVPDDVHESLHPQPLDRHLQPKQRFPAPVRLGSPNAAGHDDDERLEMSHAGGGGRVAHRLARCSSSSPRVTIVLVLQKTKQALLPAKQTPVLWAAELATIAGVLILRSGWGRDNRWAEEQARLGTLANNFYEPRREALVNGGAIAVGVFGALWWATATWSMSVHRHATRRSGARSARFHRRPDSWARSPAA